MEEEGFDAKGNEEVEEEGFEDFWPRRTLWLL
jgi:hypothetical protein